MPYPLGYGGLTTDSGIVLYLMNSLESPACQIFFFRPNKCFTMFHLCLFVFFYLVAITSYDKKEQEKKKRGKIVVFFRFYFCVNPLAFSACVFFFFFMKCSSVDLYVFFISYTDIDSIFGKLKEAGFSCKKKKKKESECKKKKRERESNTICEMVSFQNTVCK